MRATPILRALAGALAGAVLLAGCTETKRKPAQQAVNLPPPGPRQVRLSGGTLSIGDIQAASLTPDAFVRKVEQMSAGGRSAALAAYIQRHADVALDVLRATPADQAARPQRLWIAVMYDRLQGRRTDAGAWQAALGDKASRAAAYGAYDQQRAAVLALVREGKFARAAKADLAAALPPDAPPMWTLDAMRLRAAALLMADQPADAAALCEQGARLAGPLDPRQAGELGLLASEARRRAGQADAATANWVAAVRALAAVRDPVLWEQVVLLKPLEEPWPSAVVVMLGDADASRGDPLGSATTQPVRTQTETQATIHARIGQWRLDRGETQAALLTFAQAESLSTDPPTRAQARLGQAQALVQLGQRGPATTLLAALTDHPLPQIARPATALLGVLRVQDGQVNSGLTLLRRAVESDEGVDWPRRGQAEADLGLAYLLAGDEAAGLRWLHRAQQRFEQDGQLDLLRQSLANEAKYLEQMGRKDDARPIQERVTRLAQGSEVLTGGRQP